MELQKLMNLSKNAPNQSSKMSQNTKRVGRNKF